MTTFTTFKMHQLNPIFVFALILTFFSLNLNAQKANSEVLLQVGDDEVTTSEFLAVYKKNNVEGEVLDKKSMDEYLKLYINFKLKVKEAETLGLDTVRSFINELKGYRDQLAKPYFVDEEVNAQLLQEAYNRKKKDLRVSHILIRTDKFATPKDTLEAYNKISEIRKRIVEGGENFNAVAEEVSEDPSARDMAAKGFQPARKGNKGDIGYFTVFDMVLPFEDASYRLNKGDISDPVRTEFGYHLIYVQRVEPALGKVQVAHLFLKMPDKAATEDSLKIKTRIDSIYTALNSDAKWSDLVQKLSDDKSSASNDGKLPWFGSNRMVPVFIDAIRTIADTGQMSEPVLTSYGWHIIKLVDTKPIGSFEDEKADLKQSLAKDKRSDKSKESIIRRIKSEENYKQNDKALEAFNAIIDSSVYKRKWEVGMAEGMNDILFSIGDEVYTQQDFAEYLSKHQSISNKETIAFFINKSFEKFVDEKVIDFEDARLEEKYPEFRALVKEYRDGILLFELTDQMVWSKAIKDTTGLRKFYEKNKNKYKWDSRIQATLITSMVSEDVEKAHGLINNGMKPEKIAEILVNDKPLDITIKDKKFAKGQNELVDEVDWKTGISHIVYGEDGITGFVIINELIAPEPKSLSEARGLITADYQNYLEKEWIKELKGKYTVKVNEDVLTGLK